MKKIIILLFMFCLVLTGCSSKEEEANNANATWDHVEYDTIEEMNKAAGTNITSAPIAGKSDEWFGVISSNLAQYKFVANGEEWTIRASKNTESDISGIYSDSITFDKDVTSVYYTDEYYLYRFFFDDTQYVIILNVKDKDIQMAHFDEVCGEFKTNITGVKSGYDNELVIEGDDVIYRIVMYNEDGTTTTMETIYSFEDDKMVSIVSNTMFETQQAAKEYYDLLIENGRDPSEITLDGTTISSSMNQNLEFYEGKTKQAFFDEMKNSLGL